MIVLNKVEHLLFLINSDNITDRCIIYQIGQKVSCHRLNKLVTSELWLIKVSSLVVTNSMAGANFYLPYFLPISL